MSVVSPCISIANTALTNIHLHTDILLLWLFWSLFFFLLRNRHMNISALSLPLALHFDFFLHLSLILQRLFAHKLQSLLLANLDDLCDLLFLSHASRLLIGCCSLRHLQFQNRGPWASTGSCIVLVVDLELECILRSLATLASVSVEKIKSSVDLSHGCIIPLLLQILECFHDLTLFESHFKQAVN